jgi:hypothetical protein
MNKNLITHQGKIYIFQKNNDERDEMFFDRCWFIVKNIDKYQDNMSYLYHLSLLWVNHKYLKVTYNEEIMKAIQSVST